MTIKRSSLTAFFIALTLSIGLVSVNLPLTVTAQNNALSQSGNSDSEQGTKQSQSSDQNGQVVSGDSSILSGNNILCEDQDNSDESEVLNEMCNLEETNSPPGDQQSVVGIWINVAPGACPPGKCSITAQSPNGGGFFKDDLPSGQSSYALPVPVGGYFLIQALVNSNVAFITSVNGALTFSFDCLNVFKNDKTWSCDGIKSVIPTRIDISFSKIT